MTTRAKYLLAAGLFAGMATGCKTDFEVNAPYREIPVVYGLLNISDSVQWVRISKAFLGEGNALVMAQQPDSINYPDILDARIEEYGPNKKLLLTLDLWRDSSQAKDPGLFANQPNILYRTAPGISVVGANRYVLKVHNSVTDSTITAGTDAVDSITIFSPVDQPSVAINFVGGFPFPVKWSVLDEGYLYQLVIRFYFDETNTSSGVVTNRYLDWFFPELKKSDSQAGEILLEINGEDFYKFLEANLQPATNIKRHAGRLDFNFTVAGEDFSTYFEVNQPPTGLNQNIPTYTNIEGGIGLFSSRLTQSVKDKALSVASLDSLIYGSHTHQLGFE